MIFKIEKTTTSDVSDIDGTFKKDGEWYINIDTIDELLSLCEIESMIVLSDKKIEIYDGYRE